MDERDNWKVHFADTMRGGQYVNNWRMAQLHAQEAPARVRELEAWGAVFDRTPDGRILQRNFGGHRYPRLAHVGDRTGLEMIRTLQDHGIHQRHRSLHGVHRRPPAQGRRPRLPAPSAYYRETGRFVVFKAKAVVLATGGIGKAYKITSNSWEYTGDGHTLAYDAGAELQDMEFVQFHPTGMIWPPSVRGILVTEGVRGEGGILLNNKGERFMFNDIPETVQEPDRQGPRGRLALLPGRHRTPSGPPELLTRDHVARCIVREVKAGRGTPHGGVFLDISWIKEKIANAPEHIKRKLPSMYHQFKELGDIDITKEPMEVGPTTHYVMGGVRVDADTQMSRVPGLFAVRRVRRRHQRGQSAGRQLAVRPARLRQAAPASTRPSTPRSTRAGSVSRRADRGPRPRGPWSRSSAKAAARGRTRFSRTCRSMMQDLVGIVRREEEMHAGPGTTWQAQGAGARRSSVVGNREYNPGWHTALDLHNLLTVSEAITRAGLLRKESRGGHFRDDFPDKAAELRQGQRGRPHGRRRHKWKSRGADPGDAGGAEADYRGDEIAARDSRYVQNRERLVSFSADLETASDGERHGGRQLPHLARRSRAAAVRGLPDRVTEGMVVLDAVHQIQAEQANDLACRWNCKAGKCGSCSAEINGKPRLMCMTRLDTLPLGPADHPRADAGVSAHQGSGDRRIVELSGQEADQAVQAAAARRPGRHLAHESGRRRSRAGIPQVHRVLPVPGRLPRPARPPQARAVHRPALSWSTSPRWRCTRSTRRTACPTLKDDYGIGYCNITKCCTKVCPEHITITDNAIIPLKERVVDELLRSGDALVPHLSTETVMRRRGTRQPEVPARIRRSSSLRASGCPTG